MKRSSPSSVNVVISRNPRGSSCMKGFFRSAASTFLNPNSLEKMFVSDGEHVRTC